MILKNLDFWDEAPSFPGSFRVWDPWNWTELVKFIIKCRIHTHQVPWTHPKVRVHFGDHKLKSINTAHQFLHRTWFERPFLKWIYLQASCERWRGSCWLASSLQLSSRPLSWARFLHLRTHRQFPFWATKIEFSTHRGSEWERSSMRQQRIVQSQKPDSFVALFTKTYM